MGNPPTGIQNNASRTYRRRIKCGIYDAFVFEIMKNVIYDV